FSSKSLKRLVKNAGTEPRREMLAIWDMKSEKVNSRCIVFTSNIAAPRINLNDSNAPGSLRVVQSVAPTSGFPYTFLFDSGRMVHSENFSQRAVDLAWMSAVCTTAGHAHKGLGEEKSSRRIYSYG